MEIVKQINEMIEKYTTMNVKYMDAVHENIKEIKALEQMLGDLKSKKCPVCDGTGIEGYDRCEPPNAYICDECDGSGMVDSKCVDRNNELSWNKDGTKTRCIVCGGQKNG